MEEMLSFLSRSIKENGISTDDFIQNSGLNRSQFYKNVKDAQRFSDEDLNRMSSALMLNEEQKSYLFSFKYAVGSESDEIKKRIKNILFTHSNKNICDEFNFYDPIEGGIFKWPADTLANYIVNKLWPAPPEDSILMHNSIHITIYNCKSIDILSTLTELFATIEKKINDNSSSSLRIAHFINELETKSLFQEFEFFEKILPMMSMFSDYTYKRRSLEFPIWNKCNDLCLIKYEKKFKKYKKDPNEYESQTRFLVLNMNRESKCQVAAFEKKYMYDFFRQDAKGLTFDSPFGNNPLYISKTFFETSVTHKKIMFNYDLCFDDIDIAHWRNLFSEIKDSKIRVLLARELDPRNYYDVYDRDQKIEFALEYIGKRYKSNIENSAITIISAKGLAEFTERRYINDLNIPVISSEGEFMLGKEFAFSSTVVKEILTEIKKHLGENNGQRFYITKPVSQKQPYVFCLFKDAYLWSRSLDSIHVIDKDSFYSEKKVVNAIFSYIETELIAKREEPASELMSDSEAEEYIDKLIKKCDVNPT